MTMSPSTWRIWRDSNQGRGVVHALAAFAVAVAAVASIAAQNVDVEVDRRIHAVENGLVPFTTPRCVFEADSTGSANSQTLRDRMKHYKVPGVSIAAIEDGKPAWAKGYGVLSVGGDTPVTTGTCFQAASTSKLVTAAIVLRHVESGILQLDEDVNVYLKSWKLRENEFTRQQKVTLRLLLTHQAGLPATDFPEQEGAGAPSLIQVLDGEAPAMNKPAIVECTPGTKWLYSNLGFLVIQLVLEDATGKPFPRLARETVFEPLGMDNSTFTYPPGQGICDGEAMPHDADGVLRRPELPPTALAQGGLVTTPSDLALFAAELMSAYAGSSDRLLSRETMRQMFRRELELDPEMFGVPLGEGLGTFLYGEGEDLVFTHPGSNSPGMNCWLVGHPGTGTGIVVMTNGAMGEVLAMEIIAAFNRAQGDPGSP